MTLAMFAAVPATAAHASITSPEKQMMNEINAARRAHGLRLLSWSSSLSDNARAHSRAMVARATLFHTSNLASVLSEYSWSLAGENVGYGPTITSIFDAFMKSPGHRANNLNSRYRTIGAGVVYRGSVPWITVQFYG
jgi:uncharacterized protein YkwD